MSVVSSGESPDQNGGDSASFTVPESCKAVCAVQHLWDSALLRLVVLEL